MSKHQFKLVKVFSLDDITNDDPKILEAESGIGYLILDGVSMINYKVKDRLNDFGNPSKLNEWLKEHGALMEEMIILKL